MHKVLTPYGMRKTDRLNKAQVRKVANLVVWKSKNQRSLGEFEKQMLSEYPALKRPAQMKRVEAKAEKILAHEKAINAFVSYVLERSG